MNLKWLVSEGYVTEYGDGKLYAPPVLVPPKPKAPGEGGVAATGEGQEAAGVHAEEIEDTGDELEHEEEGGAPGEEELGGETLGQPMSAPVTTEAPPMASAEPTTAAETPVAAETAPTEAPPAKSN